MVNTAINALVQYGLETDLITDEDVRFVTNSVLDILGIDEYNEPNEPVYMELEEILKILLDDACKRGIIEDSIVFRDLLDTKIMATMVPFPREVITQFEYLYEENPKLATDWYYGFSQNTDYIRRYRIKKDLKWVTDTKYGTLDITVNLSKPEKDPKAIAAAKNPPQSGYPKCILCCENEGYAGNINYPARQNHRIIPIEIGGSQWYFQYSPYAYYNEHCIAFNSDHIPMKIDRNTFEKMFDFVKLFPHYFIGSNADLPIVGGSMLSHDHFLGGRYTFAIEKADFIKKLVFHKYKDVEAGIVKWPMSVIRLRHKKETVLIDLAEDILNKWRSYTDENAFIFAETNHEPHNTITPIAGKRGDFFELDLVLRNNITTEECPLGVYHPHERLHHIKKENIGLIEVMGLAVLPSHLETELSEVKSKILNGEKLSDSENTAKHEMWVVDFLKKYKDITEENLEEIIRREVGIVFEQVLEDAGVYKHTQEGMAAFMRFVEFCGGRND